MPWPARLVVTPPCKKGETKGSRCAVLGGSCLPVAAAVAVVKVDCCLPGDRFPADGFRTLYLRLLEGMRSLCAVLGFVVERERLPPISAVRFFVCTRLPLSKFSLTTGDDSSGVGAGGCGGGCESRTSRAIHSGRGSGSA